MDQYLCLLRRQAQSDPLLVEAYIRALERAVGGASLPIEISVWVVVYCHAETASDDIKIFATAELARTYAMNRMVEDIKTAHREEACSIVAVNAAEIALAQNDFEGLENLYDSLVGTEAWFEVTEHQVQF